LNRGTPLEIVGFSYFGCTAVAMRLYPAPQDQRALIDKRL